MKYKLFLVSYATVHSLNELNPSVAGGNWVEIGRFRSPEECKAVAETLDYSAKGDLGQNSTFFVRAVWIQTEI